MTIGEMELAQMNARADARSVFRVDDWDEAVELGASDRALLNDSFALDLGDEYE